MQALGALDALDALDAIEMVGNRNPLRKVYSKRYDPFTLRDDEFKRRYRFNKRTASFIIDLVKEDLQLDPRGCGTTPALQVLTAIRCWGRGRVQDDEGGIHGLSQPTVSRTCARVASVLAQHSESFIKMPGTLVEQQSEIMQFMEIGGFPTVIGCIDCTHIKIRKYGGGDAHAAQYFKKKKGFYFLNVQAVCDAQLRIRDIVWRGSTHDSQIFNESTLKERFERGEFIGRLLGDSEYGLESYLFTPILRPQNSKEEAYNRAQNATRNCIERCFEVWKQRFQCLSMGLTVRMQNVKPTILALAVLHNIAIDHEDSVPEYDYTESDENIEDEVPAPDAGGGAQNNAFLRDFIEIHF